MHALAASALFTETLHYYNLYGLLNIYIDTDNVLIMFQTSKLGQIYKAPF